MSLTITRDAYFDLVGKEIGISAWHTVDQSRIDTFADVTEDHQFIHIDPERAALFRLEVHEPTRRHLLVGRVHDVHRPVRRQALGE